MREVDLNRQRSAVVTDKGCSYTLGLLGASVKGPTSYPELQEARLLEIERRILALEGRK